MAAIGVAAAATGVLDSGGRATVAVATGAAAGVAAPLQPTSASSASSPARPRQQLSKRCIHPHMQKIDRSSLIAFVRQRIGRLAHTERKLVFSEQAATLWMLSAVLSRWSAYGMRLRLSDPSAGRDCLARELRHSHTQRHRFAQRSCHRTRAGGKDDSGQNCSQPACAACPNYQPHAVIQSDTRLVTRRPGGVLRANAGVRGSVRCPQPSA